MRRHDGEGFLFLSNPKCGSTTVRWLLDEWFDGERGYVKHTMTRERNDLHWGEEEFRREIDWEKTYTFTTVREPLDRLVSEYAFTRPDANGVPRWSPRYTGGSGMPFKEWIKRGLYTATPLEEWAPGVSQVFPLSGIDAMAEALGAMFGRKPPEQMPRRNAWEHRPAEEYYDDEIRAIVLERFAGDIAVLASLEGSR